MKNLEYIFSCIEIAKKAGFLSIRILDTLPGDYIEKLEKFKVWIEDYPQKTKSIKATLISGWGDCDSYGTLTIY